MGSPQPLCQHWQSSGGVLGLEPPLPLITTIAMGDEGVQKLVFMFQETQPVFLSWTAQPRKQGGENSEFLRHLSGLGKDCSPV